MIELGEKQVVRVLEYGGVYFVCVIDRSKKALLNYSLMPYLNTINNDIKFDSEKFNSDVEFVGGIEIDKIGSNLKNAQEFRKVVESIQAEQTILFNVLSLRDFIIQNSGLFSDDLSLSIDSIADTMNNFVVRNEKSFKDHIVHQVPESWFYDMFTNKDWIESKSDVELFKLAQGDIKKPATELGYSYDYLEFLLSDNRKKLTEIFNGLNEKIKNMDDGDLK